MVRAEGAIRLIAADLFYYFRESSRGAQNLDGWVAGERAAGASGRTPLGSP